MIKLYRLLVLAPLLMTVLGGTVEGSGPVEINLDNLTSMRLPAPQDPALRQYLGISNSDTFTLPQVKAEEVVVEIFSMYCPVCQASAPEMNRLYESIEKDPVAKGRVKLVGIGAGNTPLEVTVFRDKYRIEFPLLPDGNFLVQKAFAKPIRTPTLVVLKLDGSGKAVLAHTQVGEFKNHEEFLKIVFGRLSGK